MWCDEEAGMLGFSTGKFSVILPQGRASPLLLQNIGSGGRQGMGGADVRATLWGEA